jgi:hypothetical protein
MIKEVDKIICRRDVIDGIFGDVAFIKGDYYSIKSTGNTIIIVDKLNQEWYFTLNKDSCDYLYNTFITLAEWRDNQIDTILDED